jgi:hypothetical protein
MAEFKKALRKPRLQSRQVLLEQVLFDILDRLCGPVIRVSGYRSRGSGFDSGPYQIF